uniref:Matrilin 2 n=1 Tax=Acanthochromis polyacanthus TaxID=80966 RepID=A0A3Q1EQ72_9TELE
KRNFLITCLSLIHHVFYHLFHATFSQIVSMFLLTENHCKAIPLDFVFVIDSSRSIRPNDYEKVKTFIINLLQFFEVGSDATQIGLLQYGSVVQPEFSLNTYTTKTEVEQAVRNMKHLASGTMTGLAIQYTMETAFTEEQGARPKSLHIPRIAMIVTDGRPQDTVEEIAAEAREAGIQIFAIGVGRVDMNTLKTIGSEPHSEHVHLVANFSQIETLISVFQSKLCGAEMCDVVDHQCQHICVSSPASYRCKCRKGFTLNPDGKTCKVSLTLNCLLTCLTFELHLTVLQLVSVVSKWLTEDTCAVVDHGCQHICANLPDGYECRCRPGYQLTIDNKTCNQIDYCDLGNHGCEHNCVSVPESYICTCNKGYVLNLDGKTCSKIDHCADGRHGCEQEFMNTADSCVCKCREGYTLRPDGKTCKKIDHCADGTHGCEQEFMNTEDSCLCKCRKGYTLRPDGKTCKKIDHCADGTHGCEQEFMNTEDSCVCKCRKGYTLRPDGKTCKNMDHCADGKHGCEQEFMSTEDSCVCKCRAGFTLQPDGKTCQSESKLIRPITDDDLLPLKIYHIDMNSLKCHCSIKIDFFCTIKPIVFVIDGSKSLGPANFELVKQFVNGIVDSLNISRMGTHVGLLQYSTKVRTEFTLNQYSTARDIKQAVTRMQYMGRGSMTGSALRHMHEFSFSAKEGARPNTPRVSIVFTDGRSQDDVSEWATKAKNSGVTIYTLGVGKAIEQELREIASEPDEKHLYYAEDFEKMGEITKKLKSRICTGTPHEAEISTPFISLSQQSHTHTQLCLTHILYRQDRKQRRIFLTSLFSPTDKPSDDSMCQCENVIMFQSQVTEKLKNLLQNNILFCHSFI